MSVTYYTYEADCHCPGCARKRFGPALDCIETVDREGNGIGAAFSTDERPAEGVYCADCQGVIVEPSPCCPAPDLLAACEALERVRQHFQDGGRDGATMGAISAAMDAARAAIQAAKGGAA